MILFHFVGEIIGGAVCLEEDGIIDSAWIEVSDLVKLNDEELRNPQVMKKIAKALMDKSFHPMNVFRHPIKGGEKNRSHK